MKVPFIKVSGCQLTLWRWIWAKNESVVKAYGVTINIKAKLEHFWTIYIWFLFPSAIVSTKEPIVHVLPVKHQHSLVSVLPQSLTDWHDLNHLIAHVRESVLSVCVGFFPHSFHTDSLSLLWPLTLSTQLSLSRSSQIRSCLCDPFVRHLALPAEGRSLVWIEQHCHLVVIKKHLHRLSWTHCL